MQSGEPGTVTGDACCYLWPTPMCPLVLMALELRLTHLVPWRIVGALYNSRAQATGTGRDAPAFVSGNRRTDSESIGSTSALLSCPMICSWLV